MIKSKQQSKQPPFLHHYKHETNLLFSNTNQPIWNNSQRWKPTKNIGLNTPSYKELISSEQELRQKIKAKRGTRKREYLLNDKSENYSVLCNENGVCLLQKKYVGVQPFIAENKTK
jgi:hypothetical protein